MGRAEFRGFPIDWKQAQPRATVLRWPSLKSLRCKLGKNAKKREPHSNRHRRETVPQEKRR
jgi:hypothetical protein